MSKVFANGRSILHKGSGNTHTSAAPDVCKVPTPGGPVPTPFVNSAQDSMLTHGSTSVTINGHPVALADSELSISSGDEPGTAGGLISSKFKGKMAWGTGSVDVRIEGKGVVRYLDVTLHNGNSFNTTFMSNGRGGTGFAYGDDFEGLCIICQKDADSHAALERPEGSLDVANKILKDLKARETEWAKVNQEITMKVAEIERLGRQSPPPKQTTLDERMAYIKALERTRDGLENHRRSKSGGYMFGVMVCLTGKRFAAVSGNEVPPGFKAIAEAHGCTVIEKAATLEDFMTINPRCAAGDTEAIDKMAKQWEGTKERSDRFESGYNNRPGTCAGAKLIGKSGHVAHSMTEIYFSFSRDKKALSFDVAYRGPSDYAPFKGEGPWTPPSAADIEDGKGGTRVENRVNMRRKTEVTVLSCQSCQDTLFMARCDLEKQSCE
ncbi:DUF4150 domain-containing protein [Myxococcus qinghaiensis]|uniref:DUF4150 domain-containing protein n=1 Tax=Myxococcus qinghaiensis TaxID=2906758 RepID=UPI0020A7D7AD|nr:DUF4150 domain-containing protein [Myxococcus qinghaiensis]MCP3169949.1 DUF4150 domain-containing protein [Myxococcus qinghaiensis]